jgi:hypothetical protein
MTKKERLKSFIHWFLCCGCLMTLRCDDWFYAWLGVNAFLIIQSARNMNIFKFKD